jgi:hypothetical protein
MLLHIRAARSNQCAQTFAANRGCPAAQEPFALRITSRLWIDGSGRHQTLLIARALDGLDELDDLSSLQKSC